MIALIVSIAFIVLSDNAKTQQVGRAISIILLCALCIFFVSVTI